MGLGGGSAVSSPVVNNGSQTSSTGLNSSQNSNPLGTFKAPTGFDMSTAQAPDPLENLPAVETYKPQPVFTPKLTLGNKKSNALTGSNSFTEDINANLEGSRTTAQQRSLTQANEAFNKAQGVGASENIQQKALERPTDTIMSDVDIDNLPYDGRALNVAKGLNIAYEGLLKTPRFIYGLGAVPQNFLADKLNMPEIATNYDDFLKNTDTPMAQSPLTMLDQLGNYYGKEAESYGERTKKYDQNITSSIGEGKWSQAGNQILDQIAESAPSIAVMAMTSGAGNAAKLGQVSKTLANALPFMSQQNVALQDDKSIPEWLKPVNAVFNGLSEVVFDQSFGTQAAIQGIVNRFQNEGREAAVEAAKELTSSFLNGALKGAKVIKPFVNGAVEEGTTQLAQNIVDKYTFNPDKDLMEGVTDAMLVGSAMTGGITTAGNIALPKQRAQVTELETQQRALLNELDNPNITPDTKEGIAQVLESNQSSIESIAKETRDAIARLNPEQKKQVEDLSDKVSTAETLVNDPNVSPEVKAVAEQQVESLNKEIDAIKPEPKAEVVESTEDIVPVKKGTDVVVDDTIELINGKRGNVIGVEGEQISIQMEDGTTLTTNPDIIELSKVTPKEDVKETIVAEPTQTEPEVKESSKQPKISTDDLNKISNAFSKRFGIDTKVISKEEAQNILNGKNSKDVFFQILDEVDVFNSKDVNTAKSFIDKVFNTVESEKDAKTAFRKLAVKYHPDKMGSEEIMKHLNDINEKYKTGKLVKPTQASQSRSGRPSSQQYSSYDQFSEDIFEQFRRDTQSTSSRANNYQNTYKDRAQANQDRYGSNQQRTSTPPPTPEPKAKKDGIFDNIKEYFRKKSPEELRQKAKELFSKAELDRKTSELKATADRDRALANIKAKYKNNYGEQSAQNKAVFDQYYDKMASIRERYDTQINRANQVNKQSYNLQVNESKIAGFYDKATRTAFLIDGAADETTAIHEIFSHPFIEVVEKEHPELFANLLKEAKSDKQVLEYVNSNYVDADDITKSHEYIAAAIDLNAKGLLKNKSLIDYINEFWKQVKAKLSEVLGKKVTDFNKDTSISEIVDFVLKSDKKLNLNANENKQATKEVAETDLSQKRNEEVLTKAETDLEALKQVTNKPAKYQASVKRLNEAFRAGEISEQEFNDTKSRFDDVIADSSPNVPKKDTLSKEETQELDNELKNENLTTDDFIQYERSRAIEDAELDAETIQQPETNTGRVEPEVRASEGTQETKQPEVKAPTESDTKVKEIQDRRQSIKDRISEKLKSQRGNLSSGFDPSLLRDFVELGSTYIEEGVVKASDFIKRFREDAKELGIDDTNISDEDITNEIYNEVTKTPEQRETEAKEFQKDVKEIGLTKEDVANLREELGERQFQNEVKSNAERIREAKQEIKNGYNIADLVKKIADTDYLPSGLEVEIIKQYYASLSEAINKNPTPELIKERTDLLKTIDVVKVSQGRSIQAWDGLTALEDNLANFLTEESKYSVLTPEEINTLTEKYNKAKEALDKYKSLQEKASSRAKNKKAQENISKLKSSPNKAKVKEAFKQERQKFVEDFRAELRKIRTTPSAVILPYQRELIALAPFVRKMVQSYVNEGVFDLKQIVKGIHTEFVQDIPELTEDDVRDIIAGEHKNTRETKPYKLAQIRDLERQAKLERQIEQLEQGILETRSPVQKRAKNDKIAALEEEIKQIKKRNPELVAPVKLEAKKKWYNTQIEKLKKQIRDGNYETIEEPVPVLLDDEALKLKDEYMKFKEETRLRRDHADYEASSKWNKSLDYLQQLAGVRRLVQTSIDLSIPLRQGVSVMMNMGIPWIHEGTTAIGIDAYQKMLATTFSEKNYHRMMFDIENSPEYLQSKEDGIVYAEIGSTNNENRDEYHRDNFLYRIPYLSAPLRASERAAAAWQNYARYQLYLRGEKMLQAEGKTRANSKEAYEQMAGRVMVDTGRGKIPGISDKTSSPEGKLIKRVLGNTLYGARLASAIFRKLNPLYYLNPKVDKSVRVQALKDMAGYSTGLLITGLAFTAMGYSVSFDYDDPDFLKARKGKKVIDFTGGMSTYVRTYLRLITAVVKRADPDISHEDANKYAKFATKSTGTFFRNKLAPNTSYFVNMLMGENTIGEKFNPWEIIQIFPMYTMDLVTSLKEGSPLDLLTILPVSISGLGYMEYDKDIKRAKLNNNLNSPQDKKVISFLKEKQLNLTSDINQEIYDINTGDKTRMTKEQSDRFEKLWAEYIKAELSESGEISRLSKLEEKPLKKEINKIKLEASKYAKESITGLPEGVTTIRDDDKTYELTPDQVKQRVKLNVEYIKEYGEELKDDYVDRFLEEGMSKSQAERKSIREVNKKANSYSKGVILEEEKDKNDGKVTFKEKTD